MVHRSLIVQFTIALPNAGPLTGNKRNIDQYAFALPDSCPPGVFKSMIVQSVIAFLMLVHPRFTEAG